jgi:hypothetical protein
MRSSISIRRSPEPRPNSSLPRADYLPSAPPSHRVLRPDSDAIIRKILDDFDPFPEEVAIQPELTPPPVGFAEEVRQRVMRNGQTRLAYGLLHEHVATDNPDSETNVQRLLGLCSSELTKSIILYLAEQDEVPDFDEFDLPLELIELESRHWTPWELYKFELDLKLMTVLAAGWELLPPFHPEGPPIRRRRTPISRPRSRPRSV